MPQLATTHILPHHLLSPSLITDSSSSSSSSSSLVSIKNPASATPAPATTQSIDPAQLVEPADRGHRSPPPKPSLQSMATGSATKDSAAAPRRFALACGALSQFVKASGAAARVAAAAQEPHGPPAEGAQNLTIFYGGRVVVLDGCTPARAAELILYATAAATPAAPAPTLVDVPIARKMSLQRFLSKRKDRCVPEVEMAPPPPAKKGKTEASSWLALGSLGDMHAQ
ncbi:hypothetical protein QYE76_070330 [Lolium multiflorum]|uniref:Protein TIFY n=1 Tax=Lolium multiflorum TaxID=4521 RepID=A0AAD8SHS6_LOLMU|nr:hypothetical protein QYE76_070330 [Lolium multiflorum]